MTREEVYDKCTEKTGDFVPAYRYIGGYEKVRVEDEVVYSVRILLPPEAIDAIIDCAVEEAVERIKNMTFATIDGRTGLPITKTKYVEGGGKQE